MKAVETSLRKLVEGTKQYRIPLFQRPYSWDEEKWVQLWDDIVALSEENTGTHFLGPVVTVGLPGTPEGVAPFLIVDGQQRLTTLSILLCALRDATRESTPRLAEELSDLVVNRHQDGANRNKLVPTQLDRPAYDRALAGRAEDDRIGRAYEFFLDLMSEGSEETPSIAELKSILLDRLMLVSITLEEGDNPYLIFESLNYKGEPLTQADLIRNFFFMRLRARDHERVYDRVWLPMQKAFEDVAGDDTADELTMAFWLYLRKDGGVVKHGETYSGLKKRFDPLRENVETAMTELARYADYYRRIAYPEREEDEALRVWFDRYRTLDFTTCFPFLMNVYGEYESNAIGLDEFEEILRVIESYFVRRWLAAVPTNSLNKTFNVLYRQAIDAGGSKLVDKVRTQLRSYGRSQIWPRDADFQQGVARHWAYTDPDRVKLILLSIEHSLSRERVEPAALTIEHVMPQTLTDEWRAELGQEHEEDHSQWLHTLGNLTLTGYNPQLSNAPYARKKEIYAESNLQLNRYFAEVETWNSAAIQARGMWLAEKATRIWPG